jgi:hypothetical protein
LGWVSRIREKLDALRERDPECRRFQAYDHRYRLLPVLPERRLSAFEREFGVVLPEEYAQFLTRIGDGGVGPGYGLYPLGRSVEAFRDHVSWYVGKARPTPRLDLPFPLTGAIADALHACRRAGDKPFPASIETHAWLDGILEICHYGCGGYAGLVVSGEQRGRIWSCGGQGPRNGWSPGCWGPGTLTFLAWYEGWLDKEIAHPTCGPT